MEGVHFGILGSLEAERDGVAVDLGPPGQRAFLALLLVNVNRVVSRERLIDELWPDDPPATAVKSLQVFASRLRKALDADAGILVTRGPGYLVELDPRRLDAGQFEQLLAAGRAALDHERFADAAAKLGDALALWRGPALADFGERPFAQEEAARLEELRTLAKEARIEARIGLGAHADVLAELEALVREHPLREHLHALLMRALYRSGRQADALEAYRNARHVLQEQIGIDPGAELESLHRAVLNQDPSLDAPERQAAAAVVWTLPEPPNPLIGRADEKDRLIGLLQRDDVRLVTLTGAGGTGKTRLALETAGALGDRHPHGVCFVDLSPITDEEAAVAAIAQALGLEPELSKALDAIVAYAAGKRFLLLLDNLEQLPEAHRIVSELLARARSVRVLATSRAPLRVSAEHEFPLAPLTVQANGAGAASDAVALFVARAQAVDPGFELNDTNEDAVVEICRRVDGLPLALELAAARLRLLPPRALLQRLEKSLSLLAEGPRDLPERQHTLRATIDWSYELLDEREQALFRRLGVFAGGWTLEAAEEVCGEDGEIFDLLSSLVDKSLIRRSASDSDEPRFSILETLREYARDRLLEADELKPTSDKHAQYYAALLTDNVAKLRGPEAGEAARQLRAELENLRAGTAYALDSGDGDIAGRLANSVGIFALHGVYVPGARQWVERVLDLPSVPDNLRCELLMVLSALIYGAGDFESSLNVAEEGASLARTTNDQRLQMRSTNSVGLSLLFTGELTRARDAFAESRRLALELGERSHATAATGNLGLCALYLGELDEAALLCEENLRDTRELGNPEAVAHTLTNLAVVNVARSRFTEAASEIREALVGFREFHADVGFVYGLEVVASVTSSDDPEFAAQMLGAATAAGARIGLTLEPFELGQHDRTEADLRTRLGDAVFASCFAQGEALEVGEAVNAAITYLETEARL